jgi:hypothetical protein
MLIKMQLLGHTFPKNLTPIIRLVETSIFCAKIGLTCIFSTGCFFIGHWYLLQLIIGWTNYNWFVFQLGYMLSNL